MFLRTTAAAAALACLSATALAQTIERVKLTDGQLTCAQLHAEAGQMDKAIAAAKADQASGQQTATAGTAGNVAAEVAGRTGLFGQLGGLTGALFGQVATQTAASAATQSGRQAAAQAQEREKQALARKEHVSSLFIAKACNPADPSFEPAQTAGTAAAVQTAMAAPGAGAPKPADPAALAKLLAPLPAVTALPDADPDAFFKGQMGGTFGKNVTEVMPKSKRVAVTGFRVVFIVENTVTATVRASYFLGRDSSGASSTLNVKLAGVEPEVLQAITDKAYADFLAQLRFAGREVVPAEELREFFAGVDATPGKPYSKSANNQTAFAFAPTGMPLWFGHGDVPWTDRGLFDQKNHRFMAEHAARLKAIAIAPTIVVNFARMMSSGNRSGLTTNSAETGAEMQVHVAALSSPWMRSDETRNGLIMNGDDGSLRMTAPIASTLPFGTMKEVSASDNSATKGAFDALGRTLGMANAGGAARSKSEQVAETTPAAFAAASVDALGRTTGSFARWFAKYPAN